MGIMTQPRKVGMTPTAFKRLLKEAGVNHSEAARLLGVDRRTVIRWLRGEVTISPGNALLVTATIKPAK